MSTQMSRVLVVLAVVWLCAAVCPAVAATQASCTFAVDLPALRLGPSPESVMVRVTNSSTCAPRTRTVTTTVPWITPGMTLPTEPTVDFFFQVQGNSTGLARTGVVVIDGEAAITVTQGISACVTAVTPASVTFPVAGGQATFSVQTSTPDCFWTVSGLPGPPFGVNPFGSGWLSYTGPNVFGLGGRFASFDVGSRAFPVAAASNGFNPVARAVTLTFGGTDGFGSTVTVSQVAATCQFTLTPSAITIPANGGSATVNLSGQGSDCSYTANATAGSGVTITAGGSGSAPASVTVAMAPNPFPNERTAYVTVINSVLAITQSGPPVIVDSGGGTDQGGWVRSRPPGGRLDPDHRARTDAHHERG